MIARVFQIGDRVTNARFGEGTVTQVFPGKNDYFKLYVVHDRGQRRFGYSSDGWYDRKREEQSRIRHVEHPHRRRR
jgi:hypothetical protein